MKEFVYETKTGEDVISAGTASLLMSAARWAKFLAVVGFVLLGISAVSLLTAGFTISGVNRYAEISQAGYYTPGTFSWGYIIGALVFILVYFIPMWYLFSFASRIKKAFEMDNTVTLRDAVASLQKYYAFIGILICIWLVLVLIGMILMITGLSM